MNKYTAFKVDAYTNPKTNAEYPERVVLRTAATVKAVGEQYDVNVNSNGNPFKIATIEVPKLDGSKGNMTTTAIFYAGSYDPQLRMDGTDHIVGEGDSQLATLSFDDEGKPYFQLSHLRAGNRIDANDIDVNFLRDIFRTAGEELPESLAINIMNQQTKTIEENDTIEEREMAHTEASTKGAPQ